MLKQYKVVYWAGDSLIARSEVSTVKISDSGLISMHDRKSRIPITQIQATRKDLAQQAIIEGVQTGSIDLSGATKSVAGGLKVGDWVHIWSDRVIYRVVRIDPSLDMVQIEDVLRLYNADEGHEFPYSDDGWWKPDDLIKASAETQQRFVYRMEEYGISKKGQTE